MQLERCWPLVQKRRDFLTFHPPSRLNLLISSTSSHQYTRLLTPPGSSLNKTPSFVMTSTLSSLISAPHLAAVALPVVALLSHSRTSSASSTSSTTTPTAPHITLWQDASLGQFVVDSETPPHIAAGNALSLTNNSFALRLTNAIRDWKSRMTFQLDLLSEVAELQAEDDGDEADWYKHEAPIITRARSASRACLSACGAAGRGASSRSRSNSNICNRLRSNSKIVVSAEELNKRLITLEANAPRQCVFLAAPPARRRRAISRANSEYYRPSLPSDCRL